MGFVMNLLLRPGATQTLSAARAVLTTATPLAGDCGKRCGHACCQSDDTGDNGMLLFPFEDWFYRKPIPGFPFRLLPDNTVLKGGQRLVCQGQCPREHRPLGCRLFPLRLRVCFDANGDHPSPTPEIDPRAWAVCPLPEEGGGRLSVFTPGFCKAVEEAGNLLIQNLSLLEFLVREQAWLDASRRL